MVTDLILKIPYIKEIFDKQDLESDVCHISNDLSKNLCMMLRYKKDENYLRYLTKARESLQQLSEKLKDCSYDFKPWIFEYHSNKFYKSTFILFEKVNEYDIIQDISDIDINLKNILEKIYEDLKIGKEMILENYITVEYLK